MATNSISTRAGSQGSTGATAPLSGAGLQQRRYSRYSKKQDRPYPKGDISVEIQKKAQELLREAAQRYEGFNASNLEIIAVSFEHKTFAESVNSTDYIRKIKQKLNEWHYQDTANPPPAPLTSKDIKTNHSSPNAQKRGSDSSNGPVKVTNQRPSSRDSKSKQPQSVLNTAFKSGGSPSIANATQPGGSPNFNFSNTPTSPGGSTQPTTPPFAPFSPTINPTGEFVGLTHPTLLDSLDLNDPSIRTQWINALRESIITDMRDSVVAEVYASLGSSGISGLMNSPTRNGQMDFSMMEVDQNQGSTSGQSNGANGGYGMDSHSWFQSYNPHSVNVGNPSAGGGLYQPIGNDAQSFNSHMVGNWYNHQ